MIVASHTVRQSMSNGASSALAAASSLARAIVSTVVQCAGRRGSVHRDPVEPLGVHGIGVGSRRGDVGHCRLGGEQPFGGERLSRTCTAEHQGSPWHRLYLPSTRLRVIESDHRAVRQQLAAHRGEARTQH